MSKREGQFVGAFGSHDGHNMFAMMMWVIHHRGQPCYPALRELYKLYANEVRVRNGRKPLP